jgi:hypothetical protein
MTFEEFFAKKRIDLPALELGEPALFSEFKIHFDQMGEKSFDHTKKYWFNKIRRQFPLAPEVKTEKVHIPNPLAEQTVTESLIEEVASPPSPKLGFVPKFKMGNMPKPLVNDDKKEESINTQATENKQVESTETKPAYVPKFKMKPKVETPENPTEADTTQTPPENTEAKSAYKPRFNIKNIPPKATGE